MVNLNYALFHITVEVLIQKVLVTFLQQLQAATTAVLTVVLAARQIAGLY